MHQTFDIESWPRKATYEYFGSFGNPFFNICFNADITLLYGHCKEQALSVSHALHYCSLQAANAVEEFRMRTLDGAIVVFDKIHGGATIPLDDNSIRFCFYGLEETFDSFTRAAAESEDEVRRTGITDPRTSQIDVVHYSVIPWISFTSISQPRPQTPGDNIPKITFGKYFTEGQKVMIPVSVEVNHAFMDGYHVGRFVTLFEERMLAFAG